MTYKIKKEDRGASAKRLTEIKKEMLNLLTESDSILEEIFGYDSFEYTESQYWLKVVRGRITGDNVISSLAYDIESLKDD